MEPPGARLPGGRPPPGPRSLTVGALRVGATAAALALALTSSGDILVLAVAIGLAAADRAVFLSAALAAVAVLGRWGTTSLAALAGDQAVLGPAGVIGSTMAVASAWLAAASLVAAAGGRRPFVPLLPLGLLAALVVAGPAATTLTDAGVRAGAASAGLVLVVASATVLPRRLAPLLALVLGAGAVALSLLP